MTLTARGRRRLELTVRTTPQPGPGEILLVVNACGVCRTDLHLVDGELPGARIPIVPGHEVVGRVVAVGPGTERVAVGDRVGVPWLGWTCGSCEFLSRGSGKSLPPGAVHRVPPGRGYADCVIAHARFVVPVPDAYDDAHAAPLLCAGLIGYRAYRMAGAARRFGLYGIGAAAHIMAQVAIQQGREVLAFVTPGDERACQFALQLGAAWAGPSNAAPPAPLDAAVIFAPVGALVPEALSRTAPGGTVVCAGIHMSDIPAFPYRLLWEERTVRSVANLTRDDAREFMALAATLPIRTHVQTYPLEDANRALDDLRDGRLSGAAVLMPNPTANVVPQS